MATKLSAQDYDLLRDLNSRGGRARISDGRPRHGAERLVAVGYTTSRALNLSDVEYDITSLGRTVLVLKDHGIHSTQLTIEPHRFDVEGRWWIKVSSVGDPAVMMEIGAATKLAILLHAVGAEELAMRFEIEIDRARRYAV